MRSMKSGLAAAAAASVVLFGGAAFGQDAPAPSTAGCPDEIRHNATREQTQFESRGRPIPGLIYKPAISNGAGVVLLHGFLGMPGHAPLFDPHAIQLASRCLLYTSPSPRDS